MTEALHGMGAIVADGGTGFRVWAPHADAVHVMGEFNDWSETANALDNEGNGYWYAFLSTAQPGHEYKYVITNGEQKLSRIDPYAMQVTNSVGNGVIYDHAAFDWEGDDFTRPLENDLVIYELHTGTFFRNGDESVGEMSDIGAKLDHFTKMGVSALQLMPVAEFAGDLSWGYNPAHIFAVESAYGGPDALKNLVKQAHRAGLAVIVDVVYNHFGPSDLDLWQFDGWSENGKGGIYFYNDHRSATPWGDTRPDYGREEVRRFIHDNAMMWMRDYHVDGLRFDMTPYVRSVDGTGFDLPEGLGLMRWINNDVCEQFPGAVTIAEDLHSHARMTSRGDDGGGFASQWDAQFVHPIRRNVIAMNDEDRSMDEIVSAITHTYGDTYDRVIYTESHDEVANGQARVPQEIDDGDPTGYWAQKRSTLGAGIVLTAPGIPMLFQGQEFLEGGWFRDDVPVDWDLNDAYHGIVRMYRDLVGLRRDRYSGTKGLTGSGLRIIHAHPDNLVCAFQRWYDHGPGDDVVVIANFSASERGEYRVGFPSAGSWKLRFNSDAKIYSDLFGSVDVGDVEAEPIGYDSMDASAAVTLPPYSLLVYSQE